MQFALKPATTYSHLNPQLQPELSDSQDYRNITRMHKHQHIKPESIIHSQPELVQLVLHTTTILLMYAYVKERLQLPTILVFVFSFIGMYRWCRKRLQTKHGISRTNYTLPCLLFIAFTLVFEKVVKDQNGMHGGLDDNIFIVRHRKAFELLLLSVLTYSYLLLLRIRRRHCQLNLQQQKQQSSILMSTISALSTPLTICSGGACNSIYMSTVTSLLSSFSLPLTVVVPFLNAIAYLLQLVGLVSLYSVRKFRYVPFWVYLMSMLAQGFLENWVCGVGMLAAVVWNARVHKFVYGSGRRAGREGSNV